MARVLLICPHCQKRLETTDDNIGREGQCPFCERIMPIRGTGLVTAAVPTAAPQATGWLGKAKEFEYDDLGALCAAGGTIVGLGLMAAASCSPWVKPLRVGADFVPLYQSMFLAASLVCIVFLVLSFLGRKSLVPAVLVAAGWAMMALVWTGGLIQSMDAALGQYAGGTWDRTAKDAIGLDSSIYFMIVAAIITLLAAGFFYYQCRDGETFSRIGTFTASTLAVGFVLGMGIFLGLMKPKVLRAAETRIKGRTAASQPGPHIPPGASPPGYPGPRPTP